jgi:Flp pilus assembly pilin Flp
MSVEFCTDMCKREITMKKLATLLKNLWKDESGQGATEYILLLVVVVALAMIFKDSITNTIKEKLAQISGDIGGFNSN